MQRVLLMAALLGLCWVEGRPNIVFILTDDQDVALGGMTPLAKTKRLIANDGITFVKAFATTPLCCPSRSSILTGLYLHSHGTLNNSISGGCGDRNWRKWHEGRTFGAELRRAGYRTFYAGKYLNSYGSKAAGGVQHIPEGWDWWIGLVGNSVYYNYTLSVNGTAVRRGDGDADYLTDVLRDYALEFLKSRHQDPFVMVIAPPAPHEPFTPARRHEGKFAGLRAPRSPNFNLPAKGKHWLLRLPPNVLPKETIDKIDEVFRNRWETLLAVDELVEAVILRLEQLRVLNETYVMLASDHGFHLGQFGLPWDKRQPYEEDIRIPLVVRGPQTFGGTSNGVVLTTDFAATILDMAETSVKNFGDGKSFLSLINSVPNGGASRTFLVEYRGEGERRRNECNDDPNVKLCKKEASCKCFDARNNTFTCIRRLSAKTDDIYCEFEDGESFREFYDIRRDPHQVDNLVGGAETETSKRSLGCAREMIKLKKAVDECFGPEP